VLRTQIAVLQEQLAEVEQAEAATAAEAKPRATPALADELRSLAVQLLQQHGVPGCAVGVSVRGQPPIAFGCGKTNLRAPRAADADTLFQIGSNTKTFTALAALILSDRGLLELDAPVQRYCASFALPEPADAAAITVRMLLNHTASWDGDVLLTSAAAGGRNDSALADLPAQMRTIAEPLTEPGSVHHYNNTGFCLLGSVLEAAAGQPYEQIIEDEIFGPLGLSQSFFFPEDVLTRCVAAGHAEGKVKDGWLLPRSSFPAGAICSSVRDLLRYGGFWLGDGTPLLSPAAFAAMQTTTVGTDRSELYNAECTVGLGWFLSEIGGRRVLFHGGVTNGQVASLAVFP
jgi:CubicO group peptidase (beta-lactamase class C family)